MYKRQEWLVGGSSKLALKIGVSPLVIGLTVVALGTSAPELAVCLRLNLEGRPDAALGNIVGSNICNILLILGFSSLIRPLRVHRQIIRKELPILLMVSFALIVMLINEEVASWEGFILCAGIVIYILSSSFFISSCFSKITPPMNGFIFKPLLLIALATKKAFNFGVPLAAHLAKSDPFLYGGKNGFVFFIG